MARTGSFTALVALADNWDGLVEGGPVNARVWVFQERMLASRVIHFTRRLIFWECFTTEASEQLPHRLYRPSYTRGNKQDLVIHRNPQENAVSQSKGFTLWYNMAHKYASLGLTFHKDRPMAISALARRLAEKRGLRPQDYHAGHWGPDFPLCLDWTSDHSKLDITESGHADGSHQSSCEYMAPSWSWLSRNGPLNARQPSRGMPTAEVICISASPKHGDHFEEIASGYIHLHSHLSRISWHGATQELEIRLSNSKTSRRVRLGGYDPNFDVPWDSEITAPERTGESWIPLSDGRVSISQNTFYFAPVVQVQNPRSENPRVGGLILYPTGRKGQYVRVGWFRMHDDFGSSPGGDHDFRMALNKGHVLDAGNYLEVGASGKYVIEIV